MTFIYIYIYIYIYFFFFNSPTGHTPQRILTRDGSNDAFSPKEVPFGGYVDRRYARRRRTTPTNYSLKLTVAFIPLKPMTNIPDVGGVPIGILGKRLVPRKLESWCYQAVKTV